MFDDLIGTVNFGGSRFVQRLNFACNLNLKDCFPRTAAEQHNLSSMLKSDAVSQGKSEACSLLLPFAHERFKEDFADAIRNPFAIIGHTDDEVLFLHIKSSGNAGGPSRGAGGLTRVEEKIEDGALDLLAVGNDEGARRIGAAR